MNTQNIETYNTDLTPEAVIENTQQNILDMQSTVTNEQIMETLQHADTHHYGNFFKKIVGEVQGMSDAEAEERLMTHYPKSLTGAVQMLLMGEWHTIDDSVIAGNAGLSTVAALQAFQETNGLEVNGKISIQTLEKMQHNMT